MNRSFSSMRITSRHYVQPLPRPTIEAPIATEKVEPATSGALHAVFMFAFVFSLMITASCLLHLCLSVAVRKVI